MDGQAVFIILVIAAFGWAYSKKVVINETIRKVQEKQDIKDLREKDESPFSLKIKNGEITEEFIDYIWDDSLNSFLKLSDDEKIQCEHIRAMATIISDRYQESGNIWNDRIKTIRRKRLTGKIDEIEYVTRENDNDAMKELDRIVVNCGIKYSRLRKNESIKGETVLWSDYAMCEALSYLWFFRRQHPVDIVDLLYKYVLYLEKS